MATHNPALADPPYLVWASYNYRVQRLPSGTDRDDVRFVVLCASCDFIPDSVTGSGAVACELVHQRIFATIAEAGAYLSTVSQSWSAFGRERRVPQDINCLAVVSADDPAPVSTVQRQLREDPKLRNLLQHISERWIGGKNPHDVTLAEALAFPSTEVVAALEGDDGGQTYVICPVQLIGCDEVTLRQLITDLNVIEWPGNPPENKLSFSRAALGANVGGGMGGGYFIDEIWVHERLRQKGLEPRIKAVWRASGRGWARLALNPRPGPQPPPPSPAAAGRRGDFPVLTNKRMRLTIPQLSVTPISRNCFVYDPPFPPGRGKGAGG